MKTNKNDIERYSGLIRLPLPSLRAGFVRKSCGFVLPLLIMMLIWLLNTSYQDSQVTDEAIESQYFVPALRSDLRQLCVGNSVASDNKLAGNELMSLPLIRNLYSSNHYYPVFTCSNMLCDNADSIISLLKDARIFGLDPETYHVADIERQRAYLGDQRLRFRHLRIRRDLEMLMADASLTFMRHLHAGYRISDSVRYGDPELLALPQKLRKAMLGNDPVGDILSVQPDFIEYRRLQFATEKYVRAVTITDNWEDLNLLSTDSALLWQGIERILTSLGFLPDGNDNDNIRTALQNFQSRHGLKADGLPGRNTIEALNQSTLFKYRKLALNLDRLRKQHPDDSQMVYVNIPAYKLKLIMENQVSGELNVIVGTPSTPTPVLTGCIDQIVINPEWNVPRKIVNNEILPRIKADPDYLRRNRFRLLDEDYNTVDYSTINWEEINADNFSYGISQEAFDQNSLGKVKFLFDNPYSVYLHDTPGKNKFNEDIRAFSHGCVRVQDPERLAAMLVKASQSGDLDIDAMLEKGTRAYVFLNKAVPVHIRYITCAADEQGNLFFFKDIYGFDSRELEELESAALSGGKG